MTGKANIIMLDNITKKYTMGDQTVVALNVPTLRINAGEWVTITGPSGSGKTTMLHLLGCLDVPTTGAYYLNGNDVAGLSNSQRARIRNAELSFIFQRFHLLPTLSAAENIALPLHYADVPLTEIKARVQKYLDMVELADRSHHYPNQLSGGQQQRVAIARALAMHPKLLLADEPTGSLDSKTGEVILKLLKRLYKELGLTVILVTHDPIVAKSGTRKIVMKDGVIQS
jgi:putative ABC transport system ATP-binding protein